MSLFQVLVLLMILYVIAKAVTKFYRHEISGLLLFGWGVIWLSMAVLVIYPQAISVLADLLGVGRGVDLVIYFSIFAIFYIIFRFNLRLLKIERDISKIVQKNALDDFTRTDELNYEKNRHHTN